MIGNIHHVSDVNSITDGMIGRSEHQRTDDWPAAEFATLTDDDVASFNHRHLHYT